MPVWQCRHWQVAGTCRLNGSFWVAYSRTPYIDTAKPFESCPCLRGHTWCSPCGSITGLVRRHEVVLEMLRKGRNLHSVRKDFVREFPCYGTKRNMPFAGNVAYGRTSRADASVGRMHRPTKARILPVAPAVNEGRTRNTPASTIVSTTSIMRTPICPNTTPPCHALAEISNGTPATGCPKPYRFWRNSRMGKHDSLIHESFKLFAKSGTPSGRP